MAYEGTEVAVERSQGEIRKLLHAKGAANFSFSETEVDGVSFASVDFLHLDQRVRVRVALKTPDQRTITAKAQRARTKTRDVIVRELLDQEARRIWRVIFHTLKARLVAVEEGVETFEEAFLAHIVDPMTGLTMWESIKGAVEAGALKLGGPGLFPDGPPALPAAPVVAADDEDVVEAEIVG